MSKIHLAKDGVTPMTGLNLSGKLMASMIYALAVVMLLAGMILVLGFAGRNPRPNVEATRRDDA